jgi:hypothetical protein
LRNSRRFSFCVFWLNIFDIDLTFSPAPPHPNPLLEEERERTNPIHYVPFSFSRRRERDEVAPEARSDVLILKEKE